MVNDFFYHSGIKGQKWGIRRFQNKDGTLTEEGKKRYYDGLTEKQQRQFKRMNKSSKKYMIKRLEDGKSYDNALKDLRDHNNRKAALIVGGYLASLPLIAIGVGYGIKKGTEFAIDSMSKAVKSNAFKKAQLHVRHFIKQQSEKKMGAIVLNKKDYSIFSSDPVQKGMELIRRG